MHTLTPYSNQETDARLMVQRLRWGLTISTQKAKDYILGYELTRDAAIRNYKDTRQVESDLSAMRLLLQNRADWSQEGPTDDCTHWV